MPSFDRIRDVLPSLYRPADDDTGGAPLVLAAAGIVELNEAPPPAGSLAPAGGGVSVTLPGAVPVRQVRLAPGTTRGSLNTLEFYRLVDGSPLSVPAVVSRVRQNVARLSEHFAEERFLVRLRRPGLLTLFLWASAQRLEELALEAAQVMQAHWLSYADHARFSRFVHRTRELEGEPLLAAGDPEIVLFPYIRDLSRLGSLVTVLPWREPASHRERVEAYRQRIRRVVALYRNGLGTVSALRSMVEIQLPVDLTAPPGLRDRPFILEEFAPMAVEVKAVQARGQPLETVGPLMRWQVTNDGLAPVAPTLYVQGMAPVAGVVDATEQPVVELFAAGGERVRLGIAYQGTLPAGQTLRLRPAAASWIGTADGLLRAESLPAAVGPANPTAPGPWQAPAGAPTDEVAALLQTRDLALWVATGTAGAGALHRHDGGSWTAALTGLPEVHSLAQDGDDLLVGTGAGLLRLPLYPDEGDPFAPVPDPATLAAPAVHALLRASDGTWWMGTEEGVARLGAADAPEPFGPGEDAATATPVYALHQDRTGTLFFGTGLGVFQFQPGTGHWYWFRGEERSDQAPDWEPFRPEEAGDARNFPEAARVFLPPVRAVRRGPDASLWLGTDRGIARYLARSVGGPTYTTLLEAFPDLASGRVFDIREDPRGLLWFATEQGLFRYDGRDWWQVQGGSLVRLPRGESASTGAGAPRQWRFDRSLDRWEFLDPGAGGSWLDFAGPSVGTAESAVRAVLWTDGVAADLGSWDGSSFTPDGGAAPAPLRMRYKPLETRTVDGGLPAVPRLPPGASEWRYLALEPAAPPAPRINPAWTREGRLLPPPAERAAVLEGRHGAGPPLDLSHFDDAAFAFNPAARVWFAVEARHPLSVLARLHTVAGESLDPAILDRVWHGIQRVRPAGVRALLAVDERIVRGP